AYARIAVIRCSHFTLIPAPYEADGTDLHAAVAHLNAKSAEHAILFFLCEGSISNAQLFAKFHDLLILAAASQQQLCNHLAAFYYLRSVGINLDAGCYG